MFLLSLNDIKLFSGSLIATKPALIIKGAFHRICRLKLKLMERCFAFQNDLYS